MPHAAGRGQRWPANFFPTPRVPVPHVGPGAGLLARLSTYFWVTLQIPLDLGFPLCTTRVFGEVVLPGLEPYIPSLSLIHFLCCSSSRAGAPTQPPALQVLDPVAHSRSKPGCQRGGLVETKQGGGGGACVCLSSGSPGPLMWERAGIFLCVCKQYPFSLVSKSR